MGNSKIFLVHNPVAGTTNPDVFRRKLNNFQGQGEFDCHVHRTEEGEDLDAVVRDAVSSGYERFIAAGGDGTVSLIANTLVDRDLPLGIIPIGSGNVFARDLGIPAQIDQAMRLAFRGQNKLAVDAMRVDGQHFFLNIGVGLSAQAVQNTARSEKRLLGWGAYILSGMKLLSKTRANYMEIETDGRLHAVRSSELILTNSSIIGFELLRWGADVKPNDGVVDIFAFDAIVLMDIIKLGWRLITNQADKTREIYHLQAKDYVHVQSERQLSVQGDGEPVGKTPFKAKIINTALQVIVPSKRKEEN